jgi:chaperonin cofactor prefoldin
MTENILPRVIIEIIAAVSGTITAIGIPLLISRQNKFDKVYTALFGVEDTEEINGVVGMVEVQKQKVDETEKRLSDLENRMDVIETEINYISNRVSSLEDNI